MPPGTKAFIDVSGRNQWCASWHNACNEVSPNDVATVDIWGRSMKLGCETSLPARFSIALALAGCGGASPSTLPEISASQASALTSFSSPSAIALDAQGNLFVTDRTSEVLATVTLGTSCGLSVVAGIPGQPGYQDGDGQSAQFNVPNGVALDPAGNAYVADRSNGAVRKVTPDAQVSTFATYYEAEDVSFVGGNLWVSYITGPGDNYFDNIKYYDLTTGMNTWAGAFGGTNRAPGRTVAAPTTVAGSNYFISAVATRNILVGGNPIPADSNFVAGTGEVGSQDGPIAQATFNTPAHVVGAPNGKLYVADTGNHVIRQITNLATVSPFVGTAGAAGLVDANGASARFNSPEGIVVAADGSLFVADTGNGVIRRITTGGDVRTIQYGQPGCGVCPAGHSLCGNGCIASVSDNNNCGACGNVCGSGQTCVSSTCAGPATITAISVQSGATHLTISGTPNVGYHIQASSDLIHWSDIGTSTTNGSGVGTFVDSSAAKYAERFYRAEL